MFGLIGLIQRNPPGLRAIVEKVPRRCHRPPEHLRVNSRPSEKHINMRVPITMMVLFS